MSATIKKLSFQIGGGTSDCKECSATVNGNTDRMTLAAEGGGGYVPGAVLRASISGAHFSEIHLDDNSQQGAGTLVELELGLRSDGSPVTVRYTLSPQPPTSDVTIRYVVYEKQNAANCSNEAVVQIKTSCP